MHVVVCYQARPDPQRKLKEDRNRAMASAYLEHGYTLAEIAREVGLHYATISRRVNACYVARPDPVVHQAK